MLQWKPGWNYVLKDWPDLHACRSMHWYRGKKENDFSKSSWGGSHSGCADKPPESSLTVIRSSLSSRLAPSLLQEIVGSGCPRGGWHSNTAGSPTATITSTGFCLKSSRKTETHRRKGILLSQGFKQTFTSCLILTWQHKGGGGEFCRHKNPENSTAILLHPSRWSCLADLLRKLASLTGWQ